MRSLGFSKYKIISSANGRNYTSSFLIWMPFISLSFLIALARISSTALVSCGESGHSFLIPDLRGKDFYLSPLSSLMRHMLLILMYFPFMSHFLP